jgi:hypothetical protein
MKRKNNVSGKEQSGKNYRHIELISAPAQA